MYQSFKERLQTGSQRPGVCRASEVQGERRVKLVCYAGRRFYRSPGINWD